METPAQHNWASRFLAGSTVTIFRRPIDIFWLSLLAVVFFAFTFGISRLYAQREQQLAVYWFQQGRVALVGMGVLFAAFLRAPMTSVFMVLEVSGNYSIIIPVILANTLAYLIARNLQPVPIFDVLSRQDGLELPSMEEQREERVLRVEDAMRPVDVLIIDSHSSIDHAIKLSDEQSGRDSDK
jgi:hypothetical protein